MGIDHDAMISFAQELVTIPSVFDPPTGRCEHEATVAVAAMMRQLGWHPELDEVAPGRANVICDVDGGLAGPTLVFEGHTDVVTEGRLSDWTFDPFGGQIVDGMLRGRGSADMKAGLAAMIFATRAVADSGPFPGRIRLAALVDEEGMMTGAKQFVDRGYAAGVAAAICCEPEAGEICNVSKGALRLRVDFHGKMAHGAMPHQGRNPNRILGRFLVGVGELEAELQRSVGRHELLGDLYLTPTVIRSGEPLQMNVMPADGSVWIDVRTVPGISHDDLVEQVRDVADRCGVIDSVASVVEVIDDRPVVDTPSSHPVVRALWESHRAVVGETPRLGGVPGATDGTVLTGRGGIPSVVYGPGGKWIAHQADEFVEVADIIRHAEVYADAALRFMRASIA